MPVEVLPGGELSHQMVGRLSRAQLDAIAQGPAGRRWLLLEAPFHGIGGDYTEAADELRSQVRRPRARARAAATSPCPRIGDRVGRPWPRSDALAEHRGGRASVGR